MNSWDQLQPVRVPYELFKGTLLQHMLVAVPILTLIHVIRKAWTTFR